MRAELCLIVRLGEGSRKRAEAASGGNVGGEHKAAVGLDLALALT